jgi:peptidyl-prolyl cis-trans isomerase NIMA-interacting 1
MTGTAEPSTSWILNSLKEHPPPDPLPLGWILRKSRAQPGAVYYYHQDSGESRWDAPIVYEGLGSKKEEAAAVVESSPTPSDPVETPTAESSKKRDTDEEPVPKTVTSKRQKTAAATTATSPKEIRVLHILKKHKDSRRPSSWRVPKITATKEEAAVELKELLEVIQESPTGDEMKATFEELARTESDCTSAKRGGDLGFFGRRKMQPPFEDASFALEIGELSGIVESSSGVHLILRIG